MTQRIATSTEFIVVLLLVLCAVASVAQEPPTHFEDWVGQDVPEGLPAIESAMSLGLALIVHFTGDAGPEGISQTITLNRLRETYGDAIVFVRAVNETTEGDQIFDAFGARRIPSIAVIDPAGVVVLATEREIGEDPLRIAVDEAMTHLPREAVEEPGVYDLDAPLPSPARLLGRKAFTSTPALLTALEAGEPTVIAFLGSFSRYHAEQVGVLDALAEEFGRGVRVVVVDADDGSNESAFHDYAVSAVPTLFMVDEAAAVVAVFNGLVEAEELAVGVTTLLGAAPDHTTPDPPPHGPDTPPTDSGTAPEPTDPVAPAPDPFLIAEGGMAATEGVAGNLLSPAEGATLTVASSVNQDYGPNQLVDGLLSEDEGFRPWVSKSAPGAPFEMIVEFAQPPTISEFTIHPATGDVALFGRRWAAEVELLYRLPGEADLREWETLELDQAGEPVTLTCEPQAIDLLIIRVLSTHGGGSTCEMAELSAR